jgi:hypothetical protein
MIIKSHTIIQLYIIKFVIQILKKSFLQGQWWSNFTIHKLHQLQWWVGVHQLMFRTPFRWAKELIEKFFLSELNFLNSSVHSERTVWKVQFARKNCSIGLILSKKKKKNQFYSFRSFKKNCSKSAVRSKELFDRSVRRIELLKQFISSERKLNLGTPNDEFLVV